MLAKRLPSILPDMTADESLETTKIYSVAGALPDRASLISARPFRSPHHTVSAAGLSGGGTIPSPGELSLAHNGVLFLDELPEFNRTVLEVLRQPMEDRQVVISRAAGTVRYPCSVMLVCAMNPCPCGFLGHPSRPCVCPQGTPQRYLTKVSGPLLDRLDIHIEVPPVDFEKLSSKASGEDSAAIRQRVNAARSIQQKRFAGSGVYANGQMNAAQTREFCALRETEKALLERAFNALGLSARAYDKILRVSRTLADLEDSPQIERPHLAQALHYRSLDRKFWAARHPVSS
jgi:magnesium chelatase family protein